MRRTRAQEITESAHRARCEKDARKRGKSVNDIYSERNVDKGQYKLGASGLAWSKCGQRAQYGLQSGVRVALCGLHRQSTFWYAWVISAFAR